MHVLNFALKRIVASDRELDELSYVRSNMPGDVFKSNPLGCYQLDTSSVTASQLGLV